MKKNFVETWRNFSFSNDTVSGNDYRAFGRAAKSDLSKQLKAVDLKLHQFTKGHYEFSAVVTDGEKFAYISISNVRYSDSFFDRVLYRTMEHSKDWSGGINNYCFWENIGTEIKKCF